MRATEQRHAVSPGIGEGRRGFVPAVLTVPGYGRLWRAGLLYYHAYWFEIVVTGWTVLLLTGSPFAVGLVGFCRTLPMLALGLVLGALADRVREATLLLAVQVAGLLAAGTLALLFVVDQAGLGQICLLVGLLGCGWACDFSARRALVARFHGPERVASALALETMMMLGGKVAATALGGALLALGGPRLAYGWLALIYGAGGLAALAVRRLEPPAGRAPAAAIPIIALVRLGWSTAVRTPVVRAVLLVTVVMNVLVFPYQQLMAVIAREILAVGSARMGVLAGADGLGALVVAGFLTARSRPVRQGLLFLAGAAGLGALLLALALSRSFPLSLGVQIAVGAGGAAFGAMQSALVLGAVEVELRARAMGMVAMAIGMAPFGILLAGAFSAAVGPATTLAGMATLALALLAAIVVRNPVLLAAPDDGR